MTKVPQKHAELIKAWADGATIEVKCGNGDWADVGKSPAWADFNEYRIKPEFPETKMSADDLMDFYNSVRPLNHVAALKCVADAAIAHAIQDGQVVPVEYVPNLRMVPDIWLYRVATHVLSAACDAATNHYAARTGQPQLGTITLHVDLDAIVKSVTEDA